MPSREQDASYVGRRTPAKGIVLSAEMPLILFCTVGAAQASATWVAQSSVMSALHDQRSRECNAWLVGEYVLMPEHLHFLCCPRRVADGISVERWTGWWKDQFSKHIRQPLWRWQAGLFHTRIRSDHHLLEKRGYIQENPVKAGLATQPEQWPWRGRVHDLEAHIRSLGELEARRKSAPKQE